MGIISKFSGYKNSIKKSKINLLEKKKQIINQKKTTKEEFQKIFLQQLNLKIF